MDLRQGAISLGGRSIARVRGLAYRSRRGETGLNVDPVELMMSDGERVQFRSAADGESLELSEELLAPFDMGELGDAVILDLTDDPRIRALIDSPITRVWLIQSPSPECAIGIRLATGDGAAAAIFNGGDETIIATDVPPESPGWPILQERVFGGDGTE